MNRIKGNNIRYDFFVLIIYYLNDYEKFFINYYIVFYLKFNY